MLKLDPPEKLDFSKLQEWPNWKQRFDRFRCATKLTKEDQELQINALTMQWPRRQNTYYIYSDWKFGEITLAKAADEI